MTDNPLSPDRRTKRKDPGDNQPGEFGAPPAPSSEAPQDFRTELERPESWTSVLGPKDARPVSFVHPVWRTCALPLRHERTGGYDGAEVHTWLGGQGTAQSPWVVEVAVAGRWPTFEEVRGAVVAFTTPGAAYGFVYPFFAALPFTEPPPVLMMQIGAMPGTEAESRLKLSGGIEMRPGGAAAGWTPPPPPTGPINGRREGSSRHRHR